jgi:hypothetical protein
MKELKYTKLETIKGYVFDGTLECAQMIFDTIRNLNQEYVQGFNLKNNLYTNKLCFDYGGYEINIGDLVAVRDDDKTRMTYQIIEIITPEELKRWGYTQQ